MGRVKKMIIFFVLFLLTITSSLANENKYRLGESKYIEVDRNGNIFVRGGIIGSYGGILKLNIKGGLLALLCGKLFAVHLSGSNEYTFDEPGEIINIYVEKPEKNIFLKEGNKTIYFGSKERIEKLFEYFEESQSIGNLLKKVVRPFGPIAINSKNQLCVLGTGLEKAILPNLSEGKIYRRKNGDIVFNDRHYESRIAILDPEDGHPIKVFGKSGINKGELYCPTDIAVDSKDNLYVVDCGRAKVIKFDKNGDFIKEWGKWGDGEGEFDGLYSIAIDKTSDTIYTTQNGIKSAADPYSVWDAWVQKFTSDGRFLKRWGGSHITGIGMYGVAPVPIRKYELDDPRGIAVGPDGSVWLMEVHVPCISKFTPEGKLLLRFGEKGDIAGNPKGEIGWYSDGIAVGPNGTVFVCDNGRRADKDINPRIVKYDSNGKYVGEIK